MPEPRGGFTCPRCSGSGKVLSMRWTSWKWAKEWIERLDMEPEMLRRVQREHGANEPERDRNCPICGGTGETHLVMGFPGGD